MAEEVSAHGAEAMAKEDSVPATSPAANASEDALPDVPAETGATATASVGLGGEPASASDAVPEPSAASLDDAGTAQESERSGEAVTSSTAQANGASKSKKEKRKSSGVPEHKTNKKLNRKKSMPALHLDVEPGSLWFVQMKGYPPWPAVVCDEEMLPVTLLGKRPVSARQADGSYRADFADGGKNVRDRRYPVMFLGTNEFAWQVNTDLAPLDVDEVKKIVDEDDRGKKSKDLWSAYQVAAQNHDLDYFKSMLAEHEENARKHAEELAAKDAEKAAKAAKKKAKEDKAAQEDVEMKDAEDDETVKPKSSKKRKKDAAEIEGETPKPAKTPKLKVNGPKETGAESTTKKKSSAKPKKTAKKDSDDEKAPLLSPKPDEERRNKKEKMVLYLRHKLQKGFLTREQTPKEEEMEAMDEQFVNLEKLTDLEAGIIRNTKINKVLKAILKLEHIPKEHVYRFKERSTALLNAWAPILGLEEPKGEAAAPATNGIKRVEGAHEGAAEEAAIEKPTDDATHSAKQSSEVRDEEGDVSMREAAHADEAAPAV